MKRHEVAMRTPREVAIFFAGTYRAQREHWLIQAKTSKKFDLRADLIPLYVSFAKAAHTSYLRELRRAV